MERRIIIATGEIHSGVAIESLKARGLMNQTNILKLNTVCRPVTNVSYVPHTPFFVTVCSSVNPISENCNLIYVNLSI